MCLQTILNIIFMTLMDKKSKQYDGFIMIYICTEGQILPN